MTPAFINKIPKLIEYTVQIEQPANGRIEVNGQVGTLFTFEEGASVTIEAIANEGYKVDALYVDDGT